MDPSVLCHRAKVASAQESNKQVGRGNARLNGEANSRTWFLLTLGLSCITILAVVFSLWELIEHHYFRGLDYSTLHYLYITRGIASSLLIGIWAAWFVLRERLQHENELERSDERHRSILNSTPEAIALFDESFRVMEWNAAAERLYGITRQQVLGQVLPTVPPERWSELKEVLGLVENNQAVLDFETQRRTALGERIPVAVSYSRLPPAGNQPQLFLEVAQDIRSRLQLRDKLVEVEKLSLLGQLAAGTAHHLNTPLTAMQLELEMLRQRMKEDGAELASMEQGIRFCQTFVQNFLHLGRRSQLQHQAVSICDVVEAVTALVRPSLELKKVHLRVELDGLHDSPTLGDPNHLEALFLALVSNALDAIPAGGSIHIHGEVTRSGLGEVHIDDNGGGIAEQVLSRIFEPFFTTKAARKGTGLGLAIARNIVKEHSGSLSIRNREGGGVRATVSLPLLEEACVTARVGRETVR